MTIQNNGFIFNLNDIDVNEIFAAAKAPLKIKK